MRLIDLYEAVANKSQFDDMLVFHSTDEDGAADIVKNGFDREKSSGGYYGYAVSVTDGFNYSRQFGDFTVAARIKKGAKILDLSNPAHWSIFQPLTKGKHLGDYHRAILGAGWDGVYDKGAGDIFIYNTRVLKPLASIDNEQENAEQKLRDLTK